MDLGANVIALPVQLHITTSRAMALDGTAWGTLRLIASKQNIVTWVVKYGFQVIDNSTAAAHAIPGDNNGRTSGGGEVAHHGQVGLVTVNGDSCSKPSGLQPCLTRCRASLSQNGFSSWYGGIKDYGECGPVDFRLVVNIGAPLNLAPPPPPPPPPPAGGW